MNIKGYYERTPRTIVPRLPSITLLPIITWILFFSPTDSRRRGGWWCCRRCCWPWGCCCCPRSCWVTLKSCLAWVKLLLAPCLSTTIVRQCDRRARLHNNTLIRARTRAVVCWCQRQTTQASKRSETVDTTPNRQQGDPSTKLQYQYLAKRR